MSARLGSTSHELFRRTADQWYRRYPDKTSRVFWNQLLRECPELQTLLDLFAVPLPPSKGKYCHHDGYRCP